MSKRLLIGDISQLPTVLRTEEAASLLDVSVEHLWALRRAGEAPVEPLKLGRAYRWPTAPLLALLGLSPEVAATRNEVPASTAETSSFPFATPDRQVRKL